MSDSEQRFVDRECYDGGHVPGYNVYHRFLLSTYCEKCGGEYSDWRVKSWGLFLIPIVAVVRHLAMPMPDQ